MAERFWQKLQKQLMCVWCVVTNTYAPSNEQKGEEDVKFI